jgi:hypothetical protein
MSAACVYTGAPAHGSSIASPSRLPRNGGSNPGTVTRLGVSVRFSPAGVFVGQDLVPDRPYPFAGTITAADTRAKTITVRGPRGADVIAVGPGTKFSRNGRPAGFDDVRVGSNVRGTARLTSDPRALALSLEID